MSLLDKFLDTLRMNDYDDDDEFFDDELEEEEENKSEKKEKKEKTRRFFGRKEEDEPEDDELAIDDLNDLEDPFEKGKGSRKTYVETTTVKPAKTHSRQASSKVTPMRKKSAAAPMSAVEVIKPTSMEDTREIADQLIDNSTVLLNLEGINVELAQRIIDFSSGACYSIGGSLQKISSYIFILTPENVEVSGDLQEKLNKGAFDMTSMRTTY